MWQRGVQARGDPLREKVYCQQYLGETFEPKNDVPDWERLLEVRKAWPRGVVPYPCAVATGFTDVQADRFEWGLWGWSPGFQGWLIDRGIIPNPHARDEAWAALDALTARTWSTDTGREITAMSWGIDCGYSAQALYDRVSGRRALHACKGDNRPRAAPLKRTRADLRDARGRPIAGRRIDLSILGIFDLKLSVYAGLRDLVAGPDLAGQWPPGTLHLPNWAGEDELRQLTAEILVDPRDEVKGNTKRGLLAKPGDRREWRKKPHQANEALDLVVGFRALAWAEGASQITAARWQELVAEAHGPQPPERADLLPPPTPEKPPEPPENDIFARFAALNKDI
ncbi:MAG: terminase gpA endonuclease subunit [Methylocella sp.]